MSLQPESKKGILFSPGLKDPLIYSIIFIWQSNISSVPQFNSSVNHENSNSTTLVFDCVSENLVFSTFFSRRGGDSLNWCIKGMLKKYTENSAYLSKLPNSEYFLRDSLWWWNKKVIVRLMCIKTRSINELFRMKEFCPKSFENPGLVSTASYSLLQFDCSLLLRTSESLVQISGTFWCGIQRTEQKTKGFDIWRHIIIWVPIPHFLLAGFVKTLCHCPAVRETTPSAQ